MHYIVSGFKLGEGDTVLGVYTSRVSAIYRMETVEKFDEDTSEPRFSHFSIQGWKGETMVYENTFRFKNKTLTPSK